MSDVTGAGQLAILNGAVDLDVFDKATVGYQITGTWVGTITWTGSIDGITFFAILPMNSAAATTTANGNFWFNVNGLTRIKLAMTAYTSGTAVVNYVGNAEAISQGLPTLGGSPGTAANSLGKAEDAPHVSGDTGVMSMGVRNDAGTTIAGSDGDYSPFVTSPTGDVRVVASRNSNVSTAWTQHRLASLGTTNATSVKGTPGNLYRILVANSNAAVRYLKFYNKATAPTVGTDIPTLVLAIPPTTTAMYTFDVLPFAFSTGIAYATTTLVADADATAVAANDLMLTLQYS